MTEEFIKSVEDGLKLSKRIYFGKDRSIAPPNHLTMEKSSSSHIPTAPMVYAVISNPSIVDNPDMASYQPHVHGRCDPPALIPLQMNGIEIQIDCYLDTAFVTVTGSWRVHCVMGSRSCDCRIAIPMGGGDQGSILGVEVNVDGKSYSSQLTGVEENTDAGKTAKPEDGGFLKPNIFMLAIPQVDGGSNLFVKVGWSQKLVFNAGQFSVNVPFSFPEYVTPVGKKISKRERIQLNVNPGMGEEILCKTSSHPLKETRRQAGKLGFLYEADVLTWSNTEFHFSYVVYSNDISAGLLLQSPSVSDLDQREMFCFYLQPGNHQARKVFRRKVVFAVDTSESMKGKPLENAKIALSAALCTLNPEDSFNIIAFNGETYLFSSSLVEASKEKLVDAAQWIGSNLIAEGGTNILQPLNQAVEMLSDTSDTIPLIFLITDGSVEDERHICDAMKKQLTNNEGSMSPRISTFGIGTYCNHYFLKMLALIGRGYYDAACEVDSVDVRMQKLLTSASSIILANVTIDNLEHLDELEVIPFQIPDLLSSNPLIVSGRYQGKFPEMVTARGVLADFSDYTIDLKVQKAKDIPIDRVLVKKQIEVLTAQAWLTQDKLLEEKAAKLSIQNGIISEYTRMIVVETDRGAKGLESNGKEKVLLNKKKMVDSRKVVLVLESLGIGFGNVVATEENRAPGFGEADESQGNAGDALAKAASNCCSNLGDFCCCVSCIRACSGMNDQCAIVLTQLCAALACLGCLSCCSDDS